MGVLFQLKISWNWPQAFGESWKSAFPWHTLCSFPGPQGYSVSVTLPLVPWALPKEPPSPEVSLLMQEPGDQGPVCWLGFETGRRATVGLIGGQEDSACLRKPGPESSLVVMWS